MKIIIAADDAGFELKQRVKLLLQESKHEVLDLGTRNMRPLDYLDYAEALSLTISGSESFGEDTITGEVGAEDP